MVLQSVWGRWWAQKQLKYLYRVLHFSDQLLFTLEFYIKSIEVLYYVTKKCQVAQLFFILKLEDDLLFAFHETSNLNAGIVKSSQYFTLTSVCYGTFSCTKLSSSKSALNCR